MTPPDDSAKMKELWLKAMAIWLPELPDVQLMQFYHRLPMNLTYWKGYPTKDDPYVNPAFFHSTYRARAAQAGSDAADVTHLLKEGSRSGLRGGGMCLFSISPGGSGYFS